MNGIRYFVVDVFAERKFQGNQLAVFFPEAPLEADTMQAVAREMNYAETTFVTSAVPSNEDGSWPVRIFTPTREVPFAGHPTLGTAYIIQRERIGKPADRVVLDLKVGKIPVDITYENDRPKELWMTQAAPRFGPVVDPKKTAEMLGLDAGEIDSRFPVQDVSTGLPFIICPLTSLDAVKSARVDKRLLTELVEPLEAKAIFVFCTETYSEQNDINARMFGDLYGIPEDPATGSAGGCLAAYLVEHRVMGGSSVDLRVEQGVEIQRPSLLLIQAQEKESGIEVRVGGRVILTAKGELFV